MPKFRNLQIKQILLNYGLIIALCIIVIIASSISENFFTVSNIMNILRQIVMVGVMALGVSLVIIAGHIDLSIGSTLTLSGVVCMTMVNNYKADLLGIILAIGIGAFTGLVNGLIIANISGKKERKGESFIITYGTQTCIAAVALLYTKGVYINGKGGGFHAMVGQGSTPIIIFLVLMIFLLLLMAKTPFGRSVYFIGMNEHAARMSGINVKWVTVIIFIISGICAGLAGIILTSRVSAASSTAGNGMELEAIAAVVVGGTALSGGKGGVGKTILGVIVIGVLSNALRILNVSAYPQMVIRGLIIIVAVLLDVTATKLKAKEGVGK